MIPFRGLLEEPVVIIFFPCFKVVSTNPDFERSIATLNSEERLSFR